MGVVRVNTVTKGAGSVVAGEFRCRSVPEGVFSEAIHAPFGTPVLRAARTDFHSLRIQHIAHSQVTRCTGLRCVTVPCSKRSHD